jgi:hypothetical protein
MNLAETQATMRNLVGAIDCLRSAAYAVVSMLEALLADSPMSSVEDNAVERRVDPPDVPRQPAKRPRHTGLRDAIRGLLGADTSRGWTVLEVIKALEANGFALHAGYPYNVVRNTMRAMDDLSLEATMEENHRHVMYRMKPPGDAGDGREA